MSFLCVATVDDVILHALKAISDSIPTGSTLSAQNCSIGVVTKSQPFELIDDEARIQTYLDKLPVAVTRTTSSTTESVIAEEPLIVSPSVVESDNGMDVDPSE